MSGHTKLILTSTNLLLDYFSRVSYVPYSFPANEVLAKELNVSTTTLLKVIKIFCDKGIARKDGPNKILLRKPKASDYLREDQLESSKVDLIEKEVLRKISIYEIKPGDRFSELELSRSLKCNTVVLREALLKIAQSGIIKKHPRQKWEVVKISTQMIEEITALRNLYETYAIEFLEKLADDDPIWGTFRDLEGLHLKLLKKNSLSFEDLIYVERSFHSTLIAICSNRFIENSYNSIFTLVNYHLWQIEYDQPKIYRVLQQHLNILEALLRKDFLKGKETMQVHLQHAKESMQMVNSELKDTK